MLFKNLYREIQNMNGRDHSKDVGVDGNKLGN